MSSEFGIDSCWPVLPLSDVVFFQEGPGLRNWQYRDEGIPFVNIRCIRDGRLLRDEMTCLDPDEVKQKYEHFLLDAGDFVVSSSGTLGRLAEVQSRDLPCMLNTSVIRFRPLTSDRLDRRYLRYFLSSGIFEQQILAFANGSAQLNYGPSHLKRMGIVVPPLVTQQVIGQVLGALDDRISLLRETNATLEAIAQALFKSWFVDFDPVRAKMAGRAPDGMDEATAALFPDALEETALGVVPKGWKYQSISDVVEGVYDGPHATPPEADSGGVFLGIKNLTGTALDLSEIRYIGDAEWVKWTKRVEPRAGDIVFSYEATLGFFALIPPDLRCCLGRRLALIRPLDKDGAGHFWFHQFVAQPFQALLAKHTIQGATVNRIALKEFPSYPVLVPPLPLRLAFHDLASGLWSKIQANQAQAQSLVALRDTLLPRLISGQLRLPEAQAQLEDALA